MFGAAKALNKVLTNTKMLTTKQHAEEVRLLLLLLKKPTLRAQTEKVMARQSIAFYPMRKTSSPMLKRDVLSARPLAPR